MTCSTNFPSQNARWNSCFRFHSSYSSAHFIQTSTYLLKSVHDPSISAPTYTSYNWTWKVWRSSQQEANPCNFLIWMHVELLPNRTHHQRSAAGGSCQRQFVSSLACSVGRQRQVAPVAHSLVLQCNNVGFVLQPQEKAWPRGRTLWLGVSLTLLQFSHLPKAQGRPA